MSREKMRKVFFLDFFDIGSAGLHFFDIWQVRSTSSSILALPLFLTAIVVYY
jgi:hypothetical protein